MNLSNKPPLMLAPGSVRAILALLVISALLWNFLAFPTKTTDATTGKITESRALGDTDVLLIVGVLVAYGAMRVKSQGNELEPIIVEHRDIPGGWTSPMSGIRYGGTAQPDPMPVTTTGASNPFDLEEVGSTQPNAGERGE